MFNIKRLFKFTRNGEGNKPTSLSVLHRVFDSFEEFFNDGTSAEMLHRKTIEGIQELLDISGLPSLFRHNNSQDKIWYSADLQQQQSIKVTRQLYFLADDATLYDLQKDNPLIKHILEPQQVESFRTGYLFHINRWYYLLLFFEDFSGSRKEIIEILTAFIRRAGALLQGRAALEQLHVKKESLQNERDQLQQKLLGADRSLRRRSYEINNILEISSELYSILDLEQLMNSALLILVGQIGCEKSFALLNQPEEGTFLQHYSKGFGADSEGFFIEWNHPVVEYLSKRKQPVYTDDLEQLPEMKELSERLKKEHIYILAPITYADRMLGIIGCGQKLFGGDFDANDIQMFSILINIISVSVSNARMYENVKKLSLTDAMTDLNNYRSFEIRLKEEINRSRRKKSCVSLLMLDIDNFKNYNDNLGHQAGDEALRGIGRILRSVSRDEDIVNRYGGEEFSIVLPDLPKKSLHVLAERIRASVEAERFYRQEVQPEGRLTISLGGAVFPDDAEDFKGLVKCADTALYASKQAGRNRFTLYKDKMLDSDFKK